MSAVRGAQGRTVVVRKNTNQSGGGAEAERRRSGGGAEADREDGRLRRQEAASPRNETAAVHSASFRSSSAPVAGTRHREARRGIVIVMLRYRGAAFTIKRTVLLWDGPVPPVGRVLCDQKTPACAKVLKDGG
jgi:hypothetical protein